MDLFVFQSLLFSLLFVGSRATQDILPPEMVETLEHRNVTLKTLLDKPKYTFIIWNLEVEGQEPLRIATVGPGGLNVNDPYQGRADIDSTNGFLTLADVKAEDSGEYRIDLILASGDTDTAATHLRVLKQVTDVKIAADVAEAVEHNSTVVLKCTARGNFLKFSWSDKGKAVTGDGARIKLAEDESSSSLTFSNVLRNDLVGPVVCSAENKMSSSVSAPFNMTVYYGPEDVSIGPTAVPPVLRSGSDYSLTCSASSRPPAVFTWFKGDQQVMHEGAVLALSLLETTGMAKTPGTYHCRASNEKTGRTVASKPVSFSVMDAISGTKLSGPPGPLMAGNSSANLSCKAEAGTVKSTAWLKDGGALMAGPRVTFAADKSSVFINPVQKEDYGVYTCQLVNPISVDKATFTLAVIFGPDPVEVTGPEQVEVTDRVELTCKTASYPPPAYTWKFNGTLTPVKTKQYVIDSAVYANTGLYVCEAFNNVTAKTMKNNHFLIVREEGALEEDEGLSDGAIAGIVIGVLVALGAAIGLFMYCRQKVPVESPY